MNRSDSIVSMLYIKREIITSSTYSLCTGDSVSKDIEIIKEILAEFKVFKEEFGKMKSYVMGYRI